MRKLVIILASVCAVFLFIGFVIVPNFEVLKPVEGFFTVGGIVLVPLTIFAVGNLMNERKCPRCGAVYMKTRGNNINDMDIKRCPNCGAIISDDN